MQLLLPRLISSHLISAHLIGFFHFQHSVKQNETGEEKNQRGSIRIEHKYCDSPIALPNAQQCNDSPPVNIGAYSREDYTYITIKFSFSHVNFCQDLAKQPLEP